MSKWDAFDGFASDVGDEDAARWAAGLAKVALVVIALGLVVTAVVWVVFSAELGAGILSGVFAGTVGVLILRQAILAERQ